MTLNIETTVLLYLCFVLAFVFPLSDGAVHKVGDSAGWTIIGNVDYRKWAASKSFKIGDIILFQYNPAFHNVLQVHYADYKSCNASSPVSIHSTGSDSFAVNTYGHHLFICSVLGHCQSGQKVDINVIRSTSTTPTLPGFRVSPPASLTPTPPRAGVPQLSQGAHHFHYFLLLIVQLFVVTSYTFLD